MNANITDDQIRRLRAEAGQHGDLLQVAICDVALLGIYEEVPESCEDHFPALERLGIYPAHFDADVVARALCARAISEAAR